MLPTTDWRERTEFLEKRTLYVFSLELYLQADAGPRVEQGDRVRAAAADPAQVAVLRDAQPGAGLLADTYHVLNDELTVTVDGAVHELPLARVADLQDWWTARGMGTFDLDGRARLSTHDQASISMLYGGVLRLGWRQGDGLLEPGVKLQGSVQMVARFEVDRPKYRWLSQAQLVGFGEATVTDPRATGGAQPAAKIINLSIDFYSAL
jgi:hypothetical protein